MKNVVTVFCISVFCLLLVSSPVSSEQVMIDLHEIADLGTYAEANDINDLGVVVGTCEYGGFVWDRENGLLLLSTDSIKVTPRAVNNLGYVTGSFSSPDFEGSHAFIWSPLAGLQDLGIDDRTTRAYDINDNNQIVGTYDNGRNGFIWDEINGMQDIGNLGQPGVNVNDINNFGQIVGSSKTSSGEFHAFIWDNINGMQDLWSSGCELIRAFAINESGQIVGDYSYLDGDNIILNAYIWDSANGLQSLGTLGDNYDQAFDINSHGQVVGDSGSTIGEPFSYAYIWDAENGMQNLGSFGGSTSQAKAINENGAIVGYSCTTDGNRHAFLIEGETQTPNTVPVAEAGDDVVASGNETVTLTGDGSYDPDGDAIVYYSWKRLPDNVIVASGEEPTAEITALGRSEEIMELTVRDARGGLGKDTMTIINTRVSENSARLNELGRFVNPSLQITSLTDGQTVSGIVSVDLFTNNEANLRYCYLKVDNRWIGTDAFRPFNFQMDTRRFPNGSHTLSVTGYFRNALQKTNTATITIVTENPAMASPEINITSPSEGETVNGMITVSTDATTDDFYYIYLYVDGSYRDYDMETFSFSLDTTSMSNGTHQLKVYGMCKFRGQYVHDTINIDVDNN